MGVHAALQDVSELSEALGSEFDIEVCQLSKGRFSGELHSWPLSQVVVSSGFLARSVQIAGVSNQTVTLLVNQKASERGMILNGLTLEPEDVLATPFRKEHCFVLPEAFHGVVLQLSHPELRDHDFPTEQYLAGANVLREFALSIVKLGADLDGKAREALGSRCVELVLQSLPVPSPDRAQTLTCRRRAALQAADLIHHDPQAALPMKLLCRHTHVGERTLRDGFIEVFGLPPMEYILALRLNRVRRRLRQGGANLTVARAATEQGFWHLSRFAEFYRRFFGELPSETLNQTGCR